ncbi:hypothetical protein FisN_6Lh291 [Fistulifera solaris]|uniref:PDZ domain-containing protein n=1 Tax=Fistulifera solaris TaxID=1519565 RepID=A0A1Z5J5S3_FISSO|nr:hypothetical protein FisN_6Lh291 [Fistulifera solaris]|eukprot:GAX09340.1 hypothetical protein FisN_6Lh291 [Fistulifera solaris]
MLQSPKPPSIETPIHRPWKSLNERQSDIVVLEPCDIVEDHDGSHSEEWDRFSGIELGLDHIVETDLSVPLLENEVRAVPLSSTTDVDVHLGTSSFSHSRPALLFCRVWKPHADANVGIFLRRRGDAVYISRISPDGLFARSNIRAGDRILSVNGASCLKRSAKQVRQLFQDAPTAVSLIVHNEDGNPNLVSNASQKHCNRRKVGLSFRNRRGALSISGIDPSGIFADSLLISGQRCLQVNEIPTPNMRSAAAGRIIADAHDFVTILSSPDESAAMVIACERRRKFMGAFAVGVGIAIGSLGAFNGVFSSR